MDTEFSQTAGRSRPERARASPGSLPLLGGLAGAALLFMLVALFRGEAAGGPAAVPGVPGGARGMDSPAFLAMKGALNPPGAGDASGTSGSPGVPGAVAGEPVARHVAHATEPASEVPPGTVKSDIPPPDGQLSVESEHSVIDDAAGATGLDPDRGQRAQAGAFPSPSGKQEATAPVAVGPGVLSAPAALAACATLIALALLGCAAGVYALGLRRARASAFLNAEFRTAGLAAGEGRIEAPASPQSRGHGKDAGKAAPFAAARSASPERLSALLERERPQTIALILTFLPPENARRVLAALPEDRRLEVAGRLARLEPACADAVAEIERELERRLADPAAPHDPVPPATEGPEEAARVLTRAGSREVREAAGEISAAEWALALRAASDAVVRRILRSLPRHAAAAVREELERLGPVCLREVEDAQVKIAGVLLRLERAGTAGAPGRNSRPARLEPGPASGG